MITPNQALSPQQVDTAMGSTAGGVLQTAQRIGSAIGQAVIGAVFFASLPAAVEQVSGVRRHAVFGTALSHAVWVTLAFVAAALALGMVDLVLSRRRDARRPAPAAAPVPSRGR